MSVCRLLEDDIPTIAFWFDGWRHGVCRLLEGDMAYVAFPSRRPRRRLTDVTGVLCVSTALAVSGERDKRSSSCHAVRGEDGQTYEKAPLGVFFVWSVSPVSGRFPEEESLEPPTGLKATYPVSPPDCRSPSTRHLRACPVERLSPLPGTPVLGSLSREYSGLECARVGSQQADSGA
ncbi:hypothetical protein Taro_019322 [Colocasia esculenta]|uniref:Uncharacterized protein n=1 Tax=Colocasia esculenta TaxID=4460 RepID=A0A843V561_COLES|nr:hypothetical protein [Colocasia esculenta]